MRLVALAIVLRPGLPRATVGAILRLGELGRLRALEPKPEVIRYEREAPGELLHIDTKELANINGVGDRIYGNRARTRHGGGWEFAHIATDDPTGLSHVEVLPDENGATAAGLVLRALRFLDHKGVTVERLLRDNGSCYRGSPADAVCVERWIRQLWTKTLLPEDQWQGRTPRADTAARAYTSSRHRAPRNRSCLRHRNSSRPHAGIGGRTPASRLRGLETKYLRRNS